MALSEEKVKEYMRRLLISRMRILCNHGFYGLLLMHMTYSLDEGAQTAYTDGKRIAFAPKFLDVLSDSELDFVMMHEILHVVLQHCFRSEGRDHDRYNTAADIVVNSNIMLENGNNPSSITISEYGESIHIAPDGKEGHLYTAEEVYEMLSPNGNQPNGNIASHTDINTVSNGSTGKENGKNKGAGRETKKEKESGNKKGKCRGNGSGEDIDNQGAKGWDNHSKWGNFEDSEDIREVWVKRLAEACEAISIRDESNSRGTLPLFAQRFLKSLTEPQTDWRSILNEFVQEEVNDYSFSPPDRRFQDSPFFLPDFNEKGESDEVEDILFMIDTSGSISDDMMTAAYSEIKGAIDQFNGRLCGWLGFFDAAIIEPKPFSGLDEFFAIKPEGGGGTDFQIIFEYVSLYMEDNPPASIIILTDGYAPFPNEKETNGIPVLWLINNEDVTPPWGKVTRINV